MLRNVVIILFLTIFISIYCSLYFIPREYSIYVVFLTTPLPLIFIAWMVAYYIYDLFNVRRVKPEGRAVLITGCSSGFGFELAKRLDKMGFTVFAGVRNVQCDGARELRKVASGRLQVVRLDVTSPEQVDEVMAEIATSGLPLFALVNNAGMAQGLPVDWGSDIDQYRDHFEVNFYGVVRMTKAALPALRAARGRVINVSSYASRVSMPFMAAYCASKHAQRAFTNALRVELARDRVQVINIEPTFYRTPILDFDRMRANQLVYFRKTPEAVQNHYDARMIHRIRNSDQITQMFTRQNVGEVIDNLVKAVTLREPKVTYRCCGYLDLGIWFCAMLPEIIVDQGMRFMGFNSAVYKISKLVCKITRKPIFPEVGTDDFVRTL